MADLVGTAVGVRVEAAALIERIGESFMVEDDWSIVDTNPKTPRTTKQLKRMEHALHPQVGRRRP